MAEKKVRSSKLPLIFSILIIASLFACYFFWPAFQAFVNEAYTVLSGNDEKKISAWVSQFGAWGPVLIFVAMVAQMFLFVIPSVVVMLVTILAYGPLWGSVITVTGILLVSSLGYAIGASLGPVTVGKLVGSSTQKKIGYYMQQYGVWAVIIARINPLFSNDTTSFVAGLLKMGYGRFIAGTFSGILPLTIGIAILGENFDQLKTALVWVSVFSVVALAVYIVLDKKRKNKTS